MTAQTKIRELQSQYDDNHYRGIACPVTHAMKIIASKWKIPILLQLILQDGLHYNELRRQVGNITNTMLPKSLRELEADGLIRRHDYQTVPPSVTYHLTEIGQELVFTLEALYEWGGKHKTYHKPTSI